MAAYQVPQFLDSGDKIFLSMNIRQFAYALGGFFISLAIYTLFNQITPGLGPYNLFWATPVMLLALYLALGKYNGRDTEVYVFKSIIFFTKPRIMQYQKEPDFSDIDARLKEFTEAKIISRWAEAVAQANPSNTVASFNQSNASGKIAQIKKLGSLVDQPTITTLTQIRAKELQIARKEQLIRLAEETNRATKKGVPISQDTLNNSLLNPSIDQNDPYETYRSDQNFFQPDKT